MPKDETNPLIHSSINPVIRQCTDPTPHVAIVICTREVIFRHVNRLTRQEQIVLCVVLGLLLTGWAVKTYRTAHPGTPMQTPANTETPAPAPSDAEKE